MNHLELKTSFKVKDLLDILKRNKAKHTTEFVKAEEKFYIEYAAKLKEILDTLDKTPLKKVPMYIQMVVPVQYLREYDTYISMLEMTTDEIIELDHKTFDCIVNDNWVWKDDFLANTGHYLAR